MITTGKYFIQCLLLPKWAFSLVFRLFLHWREVSSAKASKTTLAQFYNFVIFVQEFSFLIIGVAMSLINSKLCKFEINYALFFSIISGKTVCSTTLSRYSSNSLEDVDHWYVRRLSTTLSRYSSNSLEDVDHWYVRRLSSWLSRHLETAYGEGG